MITRVRDEERAAAMVIAIMVSMVVMLLSIFVVQLSIHNSAQSAYDRHRVQAVNAAEAGIHSMWSSLQGTRPESLPCASPATATLSTAPGTSAYSVQPTYYDASGNSMTCPLSQTSLPSAVLLTSTGTTNGVSRKMQSYGSLTAIRVGLSAAIVSNNGTALVNSFTLTGNQGTDADIYVNTGDLTITNSPVVNGSIYVANGTFSMANSAIVQGNVWANGSASNSATVTGDLTSSTSSLSGSGTVQGNATAGTTIAGTLQVSGSKYPNSPQAAPPTQPFPYVCWTAITGVCSAQSSSWTAAGYTIATYSDCTSAYNALKAGITGDTVVRINAVCNLNIANNDAINFTGNLAIFTDGSITMNNQNNWNGPAGGGKNLYFIANYRSGLNCASGSYNITTSNYSNFNNVNVSFYSPCTVTIANLNTFSGQILAGTVTVMNNFTMNFVPILIPGGAEQVTGFQQAILYLREVR